MVGRYPKRGGLALAKRLFSALACPHQHFEFTRAPGRGYIAHCPDCGITGNGIATAANAMHEFEQSVSKARAAERREIAKERKAADKAFDKHIAKMKNAT